MPRSPLCPYRAQTHACSVYSCHLERSECAGIAVRADVLWTYSLAVPAAAFVLCRTVPLFDDASCPFAVESSGSASDMCQTARKSSSHTAPLVV